MNKQQHRLVFNRRLGMCVPVSEVARSSGKAASGERSLRRAPRLAAAALAAAALMPALPAQSQTTPGAGAARPPVVYGSALAAPRQALPQPYGSTRRADGSAVNDPSRRSFVANPAHAGQVRWTVDGNSATLDQGSVERLILNWDSFDIGAGHSVHFKQDKDAAKAVSVLNRIWSADPSLILGTLTADRELVLVNPNGVYFGRGARVDTGRFVASALSIADSVFDKGLRNTTDGSAVFSTDGIDHLPTALADSAGARSAAISVEAGAEIRSAAGGDVLLVAPRVLNAGSIHTPQGQAVLAAGGKVYLMSSSDPAQRGLIIAVDPIREDGSLAPDATLGVVENRAGALAQQIDQIRAERGSVNLVGLTVRQHGQISATTAVKGANGAIHLQAMAGTTPVAGGSTGTAAGFGLTVEAGATARVGNGGGTVELGSASRTSITAEAGNATQLDAEVFNRSRIRIEGGAIAVAGGARITAAAGQVELLATQSALLSPLTNSLANTAQASADSSRITIAPQASISVAGLQDVAVDGARYQGQQRLFRIELADMPVQRSGPLYRSEVFFDLRQAARVAVADVTGAAAALPRTAQELSTRGGSLRIEAEGAVVVGAGAQLDVSGGSVRVSEATLQQTLLTSSGRSLAFSQAGAGQALDSLTGSRSSTRVPAYTEGRDGGTLQISARQLALAGDLRGTVVQGARQAAGSDAAAAPATLAIGRLFGVNSFHYLPALQLLPAAASTPDAMFWSDPLQSPLASLPPVATLSLQGLGAERGFGNLRLSAQTITQPVFGTLDLGAGGVLTVNAETLALDGAFSAPGGRIQLATTRAEAGTADNPGRGDITLSARTVLDAAGRWTNLAASGVAASGPAPVAGGSVRVDAARSLLAEPGAVVDVSGGARLGNSGSLSTGAAGEVRLAIGRSALVPSSLQLDGLQLRGFDFGSGGMLSLGTPGFTLGAGADAEPAAGFQLPTSLLSGAQGFGDIRISADGDLRLASGTLLAPVLHNWALVAGHALAASGRMSGDVARGAVVDASVAARAPVSLSLAAALPLQPAQGQDGGNLTVERGAAIVLEPGATLALAASRNLAVGTTGGQAGQAATLQAPGGAITLRISGQRGADSLGEAGSDPAGFLPDQALWLGADARLSVAGTAVLRAAPRADLPLALGAGIAAGSSTARTTGEVLGGGSITLAAQRGYVVAEAGSVLNLDGAQARLHLPGQAAASTVARAAGSLLVQSAEGIALEGSVSAAAPRDAAGRALADGGRLTLAMGLGGVPSFTQGSPYPGSLVDNLQGAPIAGALPKPREIHVGVASDAIGTALQAAAGGSVNWFDALDSGIARLGTALLTQSGFDALRLGAGDRIHFSTSFSSVQPLGLVLDTPLLSAAPGAAVALGAAQVVLGDQTEPRLRKGAAPERSARADDPALASTTLTVRAPTITLVGDAALQGFNSVALEAGGDIRLTAVNPSQGATTGSLAFASDLLLQAAQVYSTSFSAFSLDGLAAGGASEPGSRLLLRSANPGAALPAAPLSALGSFSASATSIDHDGVLRQPFGAISLQAERGLTLGPHSLSTVSGAGAPMLVGSTDNLASWTLPNGQEATALPLAKRIRLQAGQIDTAGSASVDASGGGELLAWEFFAGVGGSQDALAAHGVYAVLPGHAAAPAMALAGGIVPATAGDALAGKQLVVTQPGSGLAPGAYTLLPARYALLHGQLPQGAFLVRRAEGGNPLAAAQALDDGSTLVSGHLRDIGSVAAVQPDMRFVVEPAATFRARSEFRLTGISDLLARQALAAGQALAPALPRDGGQVQLLLAPGTATAPGTSLWQAGLALGAGSGGGRAGQLDVSAGSLALVEDLAKTPEGGLGITAQALRDSRAGSVLLGGQRSAAAAGADGLPASSLAGARTQALQVDVGSAALQLEELVLASAGTLDIAAGSQLQATATGSLGPRSLLAQGDGALAVVSANALQVQRSAATLAGGNLRLGAGAVLSAAHLVLDATGALQIDPSTDLNAGALALSARRIEVGEAAAPDAQATALTGDLLATARRAEALTLRSYTSIDFAGTQDWAARDAAGRPARVQRSLVLDAPALRGVAGADAGTSAGAGDGSGPAVHTDIAATTVQLRNSSGLPAPEQAPGSGSLVLQALPALQYGSTGGLTLGTGDTTLGFAGVILRSLGDIVLSGTGRTAAQQDLALQAARLTATTGASQVLAADAGLLRIATEAGSRSLGERVGQGAQVQLQAQAILQAGRIDLPGAALHLHASGSAAGEAAALQFAAGSLTSVAGFSATAGTGLQVFGQAGTLTAQADAGAIAVLGRLDASAAPGLAGGWSGGDGGSLLLQASGSGGMLQLADASGSAALLAHAGSGTLDRGGSLRIDVSRLPSADAAAQAALAGGISGSIDMRVRSGDLALATPLTAQRIALAADAGSLTLQGAHLDARAPAGGVVTLAAGADLQLAAGSRIDARSGRTGANGGDVLLSSTAGRLGLAADAAIDAGGDDPGDGRIVLRAARGADGRSVQIDPLHTGQLQAGELALEAVQVYRQVTVGGITRDITSIAAGNSAIAGSGNNRTGTLGQASVGRDSAALAAAAGAVLQALGVSQAEQDSGRVRLAPGVEVQAAGNLTLSADWPLNDATRGSVAGFLSLRAAGNLVFNGSLSDGFATAANTAALLEQPRAWSLRLAAGADLGAAASLAVVPPTGADPGPGAGSGDLLLNAGRLLRTGAGSIELAAGRDISLAAGSGTTAAAQVYVAGRPVADADGALASLFAGQAARPQFTEAGGRLELSAGRDIVAAEPTQLVNNWLWRSGQPSIASGEDGLYAANSQLAWWPQINRFRQAAASFGGGSLRASAGRDILNLQAFTPTQGWADSRVMASAVLQLQGGGDLTVQAGRDLLGGQFLVAAGEGRLSAGAELGALQANARVDAPVLAQMNGGSWQVQSRGPLAIVGSFNPTAAPVPTADTRPPQSGLHYTWGADAGLWLRSLAGELQLLGGLGANLLGGFGLQSAGGVENLLRVLPPTLHASALGGDLRLFPADAIGGLLFPAAGSSLSLWAAGDLLLGEGSSNSSLAQADTALALWPLAARPLSQATAAQLYTGADSTILATLGDRLPRQGLHAGEATRVQVAAGGSIVQPALGNGALRLAQPAEISAGEDILNLRLVGQNLAAGDTTRIQAGRNVLAGTLGGVELVGPGALELSAGGDLDLGSSAGIRSSGNLRNPGLPAAGAALRLWAAAAGTLDLDALAARYLAAGAPVGAEHAAGYRAALVALVQQQVASRTALDFDTAWQLFRGFPAAAQAAFGQQVLAAEFGQRYLGDSAPTAADVAADLQAGFDQRKAELLAAGRAALQARQRLLLPGNGDVVALVTGRAAAPATQDLPAFGTTAPATPPTPGAGNTAAADPSAQAAASEVYFDALTRYLARIEALQFSQIDTSAAVKARLASLQAVQAGWRETVARQLGASAASLDALAPQDPAAQAWRAALQVRSGPLFEGYRQQVLAAETGSAGSSAAQFGLAALPLRLALYDQGFQAAELAGQGSAVPQLAWPLQTPLLARSGALQLTQSAVLTERGGDIALVNPGGSINVGLKQAAADGLPKGVIALGGGDVFAHARDDVQVNTQRVFIVGEGDMTLWSSAGDIDSGRGANTAVAAPPLVARRGVDGVLFEVPAATTGSGLAILANAAGQRAGTIGLYPAFGEIRALDAFIRAPALVLGGTVQGADNIQSPAIAGAAAVVAAPPPVALAPPASAADAAAAAAATGTQGGADNRSRNALLTVDLLGLGEVPIEPDCSPADERAGKCRRPLQPGSAPAIPAGKAQ
jgi:filamentous hemagglutinin family protein